MAARLVWVEDGGLLAPVLDSEITALRQVRHAVSDADIRAFPQACETVVGFWSSADILAMERMLSLASVNHAVDDIGAAINFGILPWC
ncbi:hypothetical protein ACI2J5_23865 [Agrobacterium pusense]|uniref:hypothetical protein n=1 Tax=Agrobacterium pusense TaxID=648995 RepID=UPI00384C91EA